MSSKRGMIQMQVKGDKKKRTQENMKTKQKTSKNPNYKELRHFQSKDAIVKKNNGIFCNTNQCLS